MKISIIIPHYKSEITAYSVSQFIRYKGNHEIDILVVDNSFPDESIRCLEVFKEKVKIIKPDLSRLSSHGVALDIAMDQVKTPYAICAESDSFPTCCGYLDYYQPIIDNGYDAAGSILQLSGGTYQHPAGLLIKKSTWQECKDYVESVPYFYIPNSAIVEGFASHVMIHKDIWDFFLQRPEAFVELPANCKGLSRDKWEEKKLHYSAIATGVFHNGMGNLKESINTYGQRNLQTGIIDAIIDGKEKIIPRVGLEPGQFLSYWMVANNKKIAQLPTETKWVTGREGQQQEYTITDGGFKHIWCGSSYLSMKGTDLNDVYEFKKNQISGLLI